jgi:NDP-sugar pyrophosphorylase family protein
MVLSAGEGRRLRPLTVYWAKPAIPLLGGSPIEYAVELVREAGIREVVVNLHHNPEGIVDALARIDRGKDFVVHYSREPEILGTAGGLKQAEDLLAGGSVVLLNGDTIVDVDLDALIGWHRKNKAHATLLLRPKPAGSDYTELSVAGNNRILSIGKKTGSSPALMFAGVWVLEPPVFESLPRGRFGRLEVDLLPKLMVEGTAFGYVTDGPWFDIGTPEKYLHACEEVARGGIFQGRWRAQAIEPPSASPPGTMVLVGPGTHIDPETRFSGTTILGADCRVEGGARIHGAVLWDRVEVGERALIRNSVIASDVSLAAASRTVSKVVARVGTDRTTIRSREVVGGCVVASIKS